MLSRSTLRYHLTIRTIPFMQPHILLLLPFTLLFTPSTPQTPFFPACTSPIFCQGDLLETIQRSRLFRDSKTFVDKKLKATESETLERFQKLMKRTNRSPNRDEVARFVEENFEDGKQLVGWSPPDYVMEPRFLGRIEDVVVREFARSLVRLWPVLARMVSEDVRKDVGKYSMIPLENGFFVPGGRFREMYYWDSYWIVKGLIMSEMVESARGVIENFISMVDRYRFVPTANRIYYLDRSMPPLLTFMAEAYFKATNDTKWLKKNVKYFETELRFWLQKKTTTFQYKNNFYTLARYYSSGDLPRPESYLEDLTTASYYKNEQDRRNCYRELRTGAESGWDFSSRWLPENSLNITFIQATKIIPVDLNSFLCKSFSILSDFYKTTGNTKKSIFWSYKSQTWRKAITNVLWNQEHSMWFDYNLSTRSQRTSFFPSNLAPLWTQIYEDDTQKLASAATSYLQLYHIPSYPGGVPTSLEETGEQWDFPNAWAPLQAIVVQGLSRSGSARAREMARSLAVKWLGSNIRGYMETHEMYEKYDAVHVGKSGGGGEYVPQAGFGWTNGVALEFIHEYYVEENDVQYNYF